MSMLDVVTDAIKSGRLFRRPEERDGHIMQVMDPSGHKTVTWDPDNAASVAEARREFNRLKREGYQAYRMNVVHEDGVVVEEDGERITEFDPQAGKLLMSPHMRGG